MTDKMICCFCKSELVKSESTTVDIWNCPNENCKAHTYFGDKDFWQVLTDGKKAQDALEIARNLYKELAFLYCEMADDFRSSYGRLKTLEQETEEYMQEYDKEIASIIE